MEKDNQENTDEKSLTCIHSAYTMADTTDEVEKLMINNFLNTLADTAISIASRNNEGLNK
jgi:hypothetical protein